MTTSAGRDENGVKWFADALGHVRRRPARRLSQGVAIETCWRDAFATPVFPDRRSHLENRYDRNFATHIGQPMEFNPFRMQASQLETKIGGADREIRTHTEQLEAWHAFDAVEQQKAWERAQAAIAQSDAALKDLDKEEATLPPKPSNAATVGLAVGAAALVVATGGAALWAGLAIEGVLAGLGGAVALSGAGGAKFASGSTARNLHKSLTERRANLQTARAAVKSQSDKIRAQIDHHKAVDPVALSTRRDELIRSRDTLTEQLKPLAARCAQVDQRTAPFVAQITELERDLLRLNQRLTQAERLANDLDSASSPRDRALVHQECETIFGEGNPGHVRRSLHKEIDSKDRTVKKLQQQAKEKAALAVLDITRVVLDGSNLCYRFDKELIGLTALRPAVAALVDAGFAVVVIFDRSILIKLKTTRDEIRAALDPRAPIHFMASKRSADETLLREAEPEHSAVVSRDRFWDFKDMPAVKEGRVFDQNIMESRIEIPALDINVPFDP